MALDDITSSPGSFDPVRRIREILLETVGSSKKAGHETLAVWLADRRLPILPGDDEPFVWLLRGLDAIDDGGETDAALCRWTARLLSDEPEAVLDEEEGSRWVYNLLMLASALADPDHLAVPLKEIYQRRKLRGEYLRIDLRAALREALATNQADAGLEPMWSAMAVGKAEGSFLPGNTFQGLMGLLHMPDPERGPGFPALAPIRVALSRQVEELASEEQTQKLELFSICERLLRSYPDHTEVIQNVFFEEARSKPWPEWAVEALPSLFLRAFQGPSPNCYWVWPWYLESLERLQSLEGNCLFTVPGPDGGKTGQEVFAPIQLTSRGDFWHRRLFIPLEEERRMLIRSEPMWSGQTLRRVLQEIMLDLEKDLRTEEGRAEEAGVLMAVRMDVLKKEDVLRNEVLVEVG